MRQPSTPTEEALRSALPPEQHVHIPALLALLSRAEGQPSAAEARGAIAANPVLAPLLPALEGDQSTAGLISVGADSQVGELNAGSIAGRDVINLSVNLPPPVGPAAAAERLADGLDALGALISSSSAARAVVRAYQDQLAAARATVRDLIKLKTLHDLLHGLQFQYLPLLIREGRRFPDDPDARVSIEECGDNVRDVARQIEGLISKGELSGDDAPWRADLGQAADQIAEALGADDRSRLDRAIWRIHRLLSTQPSFINASLLARARTLQLDNLMQTLQELYTTLASLKLAADQLDRVRLGIAGLAELNQRLSAMVLEHNEWQALDRELRRIEVGLRMDVAELTLSWPDLRQMVVQLCDEEHDWAREIRQRGDRLDQAIATQREAELPLAFAQLQGRIGKRFFIIDSDLKSLCDRLRDFRVPINALEFALQ